MGKGKGGIEGFERVEAERKLNKDERGPTQAGSDYYAKGPIQPTFSP